MNCADADNDGFISMDEVKAVFRDTIIMSEDVWAEQFVAKADANGDGKVHRARLVFASRYRYPSKNSWTPSSASRPRWPKTSQTGIGIRSHSRMG